MMNSNFTHVHPAYLNFTILILCKTKEDDQIGFLTVLGVLDEVDNYKYFDGDNFFRFGKIGQQFVVVATRTNLANSKGRSLQRAGEDAWKIFPNLRHTFVVGVGQGIRSGGTEKNSPVVDIGHGSVVVGDSILRSAISPIGHRRTKNASESSTGHISHPPTILIEAAKRSFRPRGRITIIDAIDKYMMEGKSRVPSIEGVSLHRGAILLMNPDTVLGSKSLEAQNCLCVDIESGEISDGLRLLMILGISGLIGDENKIHEKWRTTARLQAAATAKAIILELPATKLPEPNTSTPVRLAGTMVSLGLAKEGTIGWGALALGLGVAAAESALGLFGVDVDKLIDHLLDSDSSIDETSQIEGLALESAEVGQKNILLGKPRFDGKGGIIYPPARWYQYQRKLPKVDELEKVALDDNKASGERVRAPVSTSLTPQDGDLVPPKSYSTKKRTKARTKTETPIPIYNGMTDFSSGSDWWSGSINVTDENQILYNEYQIATRIRVPKQYRNMPAEALADSNDSGSHERKQASGRQMLGDRLLSYDQTIDDENSLETTSSSPTISHATLKSEGEHSRDGDIVSSYLSLSTPSDGYHYREVRSRKYTEGSSTAKNTQRKGKKPLDVPRRTSFEIPHGFEASKRLDGRRLPSNEGLEGPDQRPPETTVRASYRRPCGSINLRYYIGNGSISKVGSIHGSAVVGSNLNGSNSHYDIGDVYPLQEVDDEP